jgi:hypothetical protein
VISAARLRSNRQGRTFASGRCTEAALSAGEVTPDYGSRELELSRRSSSVRSRGDGGYGRFSTPVDGARTRRGAEGPARRRRSRV